MSGIEVALASLFATEAAAGAATAGAASAAGVAAATTGGAIALESAGLISAGTATGFGAGMQAALVPAAAAAASSGGLFTTLSSGLTAIGALASIGSTVMAGQQRAAASSAQAQQYGLAAQQADFAATQAELAGRTEALQVRQALARTLATQRARYAAAGVVLDEGAPATLEDATRAEADMNLAVLAGNTSIAASDQRIRAAQLRGSSALATQQAGSALTNASLTAGISLFDLADRQVNRMAGTTTTRLPATARAALG